VALNSSISPKARVDLDAIWSFIAADSERAADAVLEQLTAAFVMLTENPNAGRPRPELSASIRSFPIGSYLIFYAAESRGGIKIFRVMHGRQDLTRQDFSA
jgi:toxin ParE1/3/4